MTNSPIEKKKQKGAKRALWILLLIFLLVIAFSVGAFFLLVHNGKVSLTQRTASIEVPTDIVEYADADGTEITYQGQKYRLNKNAVSVLFLGVDKKNIAENLGSGRNGQADSIFVAVLDTETGKVAMIPISRETMTEIKTFSADGSYVGTETTQLCLAYAYGNSGEDCCRNAADAVQSLLYGMEMDAYVAIDLDGVASITDAIGGVRLTTLETVTYSDVTVPGNQTLALNGRQAKAYIRGRNNAVDGNVMRLRRQKQFLGALFADGKAKIRANPTSIPHYYNVAKPYILSDLNLAEVTYLAKATLAAPDVSFRYLDITGETKMGKEHSEFYPDETSLYEAILNAFYLKVE